MATDIRLALLTGADVPIPECQLVMHQPSIKEISYIGEKDFFTGVQCLTLNKSMFVNPEEDKAVLDDINNFQIFMTVMNDKRMRDKKNSVQQVLNLIFPKYKTIFSPQSLIFMQENQNFIVDENNFDFLQDCLKSVFCANTGPMDQQAFNPANAAAKAIADKLMRGRQRVAAQKGTNNVSIFSQYLSILSVGLHLTITALSEYTMFMLYDEMERYSLFINWDLDVRTRLAGGKPESQPDNWMKNIHNN